MRRSSAVVILFIGVLLAAAAPVVAQDESAPPESAPPESAPPGSALPKSERRDLYLDMPYYLGGFEPDISMTRGQEHFANLDPGGEADAQTRAELERLLDDVGADIDDMVSGYALVSQEDFFSFVVAIRIDGIEPGSLMPAYLPTLYEDLVDPTGIAATVAGKDVLIVSSVGSDDEYVALYIYDQGDTLWMIQGPQDVVEVTLENLPDASGP